MEKPLVSIIIGIYNSPNKKELTDSLSSIENQTYKNWECIICDDGSEDDTYTFLKNRYVNDSRFTVIKNDKNKGLGGALNHCIEYARGKYFVRHDCDDISMPDRLRILVNYMQCHNNVDVLGSAMIMTDNEGQWGVYKIKTKHAERAEKTDFLFGTAVAHATVIMKANAVKKAGMYRNDKETLRCEDLDLFMRMLSMGYVICNIDDELYCYNRSRYGKKVKYKDRIYESRVRYKGFKRLKIPFWGYIFVLKPLVVGLIPTRLLSKIKQCGN